MVSLAEFVENPDNPSVATDEEIARLAGKLKRVPLGLTAMRIAFVTDRTDAGLAGKRVVISGNKRLRCLKAAFGDGGEVPAEWFADVTKMSEAERHEFIVSANVSDGSWSVDKLLAQYDRAELGELMGAEAVAELLADVEAANAGGDDGQTDDEKYSTKVVSPQYEIKGECPSIDEICDCSKYDKLVEEIEDFEELPDDVSKFLKLAATRHIVFDYAKVAEYYAHATKDVQELMERSALVIIDFEDAIQEGYVKMTKQMEALRIKNAKRINDEEDAE